MNVSPDPYDEWQCGYYDGVVAQCSTLRARIEALAADFDANGNGCALGDPSADAWHKAARQLRAALADSAS